MDISIVFQDPELAESFLVHLMNVSAGRLADQGTQSNITILASDDPYGVFVFSPSQLKVNETNMTVNLNKTIIIIIIIKRMSGTQGVVRVNYSSTGGNASPNEDYVPLMGAVVFSEGQKNATVSLMVLDDDKPEAAETIMVNLTNVQLVGGHPVFPGRFKFIHGSVLDYRSSRVFFDLPGQFGICLGRSKETLLARYLKMIYMTKEKPP